jgi:hypothetical protein
MNSSDDQTKNDPWSCITIPLLTIAGYFVLSAIQRVTSGKGDRIDQFICYGTLIYFVVGLLLLFRDQNRDAKVLKAQKQILKNSSRVEEAVIVNRHHQPGSSYEINEYGDTRYKRPHYSLTLKLPNQTRASVDVSERIYKKLENRNTVRIYYTPESPSTFMLDDEL